MWDKSRSRNDLLKILLVACNCQNFACKKEWLSFPAVTETRSTVYCRLDQINMNQQSSTHCSDKTSSVDGARIDMEDDGDAAATSSVSNAGVNNVDGNVKDDGNDNSVDSDKSHPHIMENSRKKRSSMHNQASRAATLPEQSHNHRPSEILLSEDKNRKIPDIELSGFGDDDDSAESSQTRPGAEFVPGILWRSITINNSNALRVSSASFEAHAADAAGALEAELAPDLNALVTEELRRRNLSQHLQEQVLLVNAEVVAPPILTKANLQFPKFSRAAEKRFQAEHALLIKGIVPLAVPFGNATVMIYCFWDMVQPDANLATTVGLRIAMVSLITGIAIASRFRFFLTWAQPIIVLSLTAATTLQITLSYILKDGFIEIGRAHV